MTKPDDLFLSLQESLAGRYSIDREIGRGGMGVVFLAHEVHLDRLVAIKVLPPERAADPALRERFLREVRMAARLSHPNIIPIHAVEEKGAFVFYVMAFVDGETVTDRVRSRGPFAASEGARVLREAAWALAYAHDQGIVHRDVKPDNILLERSTGRVLVADFGIAAALGAASADGVSGTPEVMSPEQVLGKALDARADIYALGATAFFIFSGRYPFEASSPTELLAKQVSVPAPPLASIGVTVPRKLASLVDRCLRKEPDDRPTTAGQVAEQITVVLEQRREVPVALRSFIKRAARMNSSGTMLGAIVLLPVSIGMARAFGSAAGFATLFGVTLAAPFTYMTLVARKTVRQGFAHADLAPAFKAEIEQSEEELAVERRQSWPAIEGIAASTGKISATVGTLGLVGLMIPALPVDMDLALSMFAFGHASAMLCAVVYAAVAQQRRDVDSRFWARLWASPFGRAAFGLASRFAGSDVRATAMTHRATELSIGLAAEQLYESLPKQLRKELAGVPALLARLQEDVRALRKQHEDLVAVGGESTELAGMRDSVSSRLREAIGALETLRLDLLRLHAGSATVQSVTTHMGIAEDVSREIAALIAANSEIDRVLRFPRERIATPA